MTDLDHHNSTLKPIRVLLLDQHVLVREGLCMLLSGRPEIQVVGEAGSSDHAILLAKQANPDIILLELNLDGELNVEIIQDLIVEARQAKIILVTGIGDGEIHNLAVQMGAMGVVLKTQSKGVLIKAIQKVHAGEVWIDRAMMASVLAHLARPRAQEDPEKARIESLSEREREVIVLLGEGLKNKDIADRLSISETTVRHHLTSIYNKLGLSDRLELIIYAFRHDLAELPQ